MRRVAVLGLSPSEPLEPHPPRSVGRASGTPPGFGSSRIG